MTPQTIPVGELQHRLHTLADAYMGLADMFGGIAADMPEGDEMRDLALKICRRARELCAIATGDVFDPRNGE